MGTVLQDFINVTLPVCASKQTNKYKQTNTNKQIKNVKGHILSSCVVMQLSLFFNVKTSDSFLRADRGIFFASIHPQIFITEFSVLKITQLRWSTNLYCP